MSFSEGAHTACNNVPLLNFDISDVKLQTGPCACKIFRGDIYACVRIELIGAADGTLSFFPAVIRCFTARCRVVSEDYTETVCEIAENEASARMYVLLPPTSVISFPCMHKQMWYVRA